MDGVRYDYPDYVKEGGFEHIEKKGIRAKALTPVYQSSTYPGHVTMATGVKPDKHGILHNSFLDRKRGSFSYSADASWIESEPVWSILERKGLKTATFFWVGSESDWNGTKITYPKAPFDGKISEKTKTDQILEWIDLEAEKRPRLIMSWWHGTDSVAHKEGALNKKVIDQLKKQDRQLLSLIEEITSRNLWNVVTLIVVSDHGMSDVSNFINLKKVLKDNSIKARVSTGPAVAHIFLDDLTQIDDAIYTFQKNPKLSVWTKNNIPEEYNMNHSQRTGDIIITTDSPNMLVSRGGSNPPRGMHGYNPSVNKEMEGIFFALGNKVKNKKIEKVHQLDLTPTILNLFNIMVPNYMNGKIIELKK